VQQFCLAVAKHVYKQEYKPTSVSILQLFNMKLVFTRLIENNTTIPSTDLSYDCKKTLISSCYLQPWLSATKV
jgi:hypothetical protein